VNQNSQKNLSFAAADETAIRALYHQMIDGWNAGSGDAFAAPFEEDGDQIAFDGVAKKSPHSTNASLICFSKVLVL
jgi:uncharacterized protein (TIGR02246 family)